VKTAGSSAESIGIIAEVSDYYNITVEDFSFPQYTFSMTDQKSPDIKNNSLPTKTFPIGKIIGFSFLGIFAALSLAVIHFAMPIFVAKFDPVEKLKRACLNDQGEQCLNAVSDFRAINRKDKLDVLKNLCNGGIKPACDAPSHL
jgi:hypothetical protein